MGNSSTADRSSTRGKANRYQRTQPPQKQHHPPRRGPSQAQRGSQHQSSSPSKIASNLNKRHRRLLSQQQQQLQQSSDTDPPAAKRRRVNSSASDSKVRHQEPSDASSVRPPAKISVTQPPGQLQRTPNGVRAMLQIDHDGLGLDASADPMAPDDKRVLRSQGGGPRSTSDLVQFFPDYEDFVFGDSSKRDVLNISSSLYVTDDKKQPQELPIRTAYDIPLANQTPSQLQEKSSPESPESGSELNAALDLSAFDKEALDFKKDPLPDSGYVKAHKRGERNEKQMRNVEKERAMHEKFELERLYDELRGPDWLKAMGISGITETEKKQYESKRDHYKAKVKSLLIKFEKWKDKEKEMRAKKERAPAVKAESEEEDNGSEPFKENVEVEQQHEQQQDANEFASNGNERSRRRKPRTTRNTAVTSETSEPEATVAPHPKQTKKKSSKKAKAIAYDPGLETWETERPITSFYAKPHEREAALGKHRRGKRNVTAFGHPLPRMAEEEFGLPEDFLTADELRDYARKRRRDRREELRN